jgi:hypothetical protein
MKETCTSPRSGDIHTTPFHQLHLKPDSTYEHVLSETYNSDAMYNEHARLQAEHIAKGGKHEVVVFAKHAYLDLTHLAQFGTTALWPIYIQ